MDTSINRRFSWRIIRLCISASLFSVFLSACGSGDSTPGEKVVTVVANTGPKTNTATGPTVNTTSGMNTATTAGTTSGMNTTATAGNTAGTTSGMNTTATGGNTAGTAGEPLSCTGSRMWGPIPLQEQTFYISESNSNPEATDCRIFWIYDAAQSCSNAGLVIDGSITEITADGGLIFQEPGGARYELPAADISLSELARAPDCPTGGDTTGADTTSGNTTGEDVIVTDPTTPLACYGKRVWGPSELSSGNLIYISEAGGKGQLRDCAIYWDYNPAQNCVFASNISDIASANAKDDGSLEFRVGESVFELGAAGISFEALDSFPGCP